MTRYKTTNVRLPAEAYRDLTLRAGRRGVPLASLVREAVAEYLNRPSTAGAGADRAADSVDALIGCAPSGPTDEARNHDHYLYGWPKEELHEAAGGHRRPARAVQSTRRLSQKDSPVRARVAGRPLRPDRADPQRNRDEAAGSNRRRPRR